MSDTDTPIIVPSGGGVLVGLLTSERQKHMELGGALRDLYEREDGVCYLTVGLRRPGLLRRQPYRTARCVFKASGDEEGLD